MNRYPQSENYGAAGYTPPVYMSGGYPVPPMPPVNPAYDPYLPAVELAHWNDQRPNDANPTPPSSAPPPRIAHDGAAPLPLRRTEPTGAPREDNEWNAEATTQRLSILTRKRQADAGTETPPFNAEEYLLAQGFTMDDIVKARAEHAPQKLPLCDPLQTIEDYCGHGNRVYFEFVKFYFVFFAVVTAFQIWVYASASSTMGGFAFQGTAAQPWYDDFFTSQFPVQSKDVWYRVNVGMLTLSFVVPFIYIGYATARWGVYENAPDDKRARNNRKQRGAAEPADQDPASAAAIAIMNADSFGATDKILRLTAVGTIDVSARYRSSKDLMARRAVSVVIFLSLIVGQFYLTYALTSISNNAAFWLSFLVSVCAVLIDLAYTVTSTLTTEFEKHLTNSKATRWLTLKLMLFKVANIMAVYGGRSLHTPSSCVYNVLGEQFLSFWFVEIVIAIPLNVIAAMLWADNFQIYARLTTSIGSDSSSQPMFSVAYEYLNMMYVGFLGLAGMAVFPLSPALSLIAVFMLYWSAKFRLSKVCGRPLLLELSPKISVAAGMLLSAIAGLLTPTAGGVFVLSGYTVRHSNSTCTLS